jgi:hypothetical protein
MPGTYPISGILYDVDGSTAMASAFVTAFNTTKGEAMRASGICTTSALGEYAIDLGNLPSGFSNADKIQVLAYTSDNQKSINFRHTVNTAVGSYAKSPVLNYGEPRPSTCRMVAVVVTNTTAGALSVDFYDRKYDNVRLSVKVPATDTKIVFFCNPGLKFESGICPIFGSETAGAMRISIKIDDGG